MLSGEIALKNNHYYYYLLRKTEIMFFDSLKILLPVLLWELYWTTKAYGQCVYVNEK